MRRPRRGHPERKRGTPTYSLGLPKVTRVTNARLARSLGPSRTGVVFAARVTDEQERRDHSGALGLHPFSRKAAAPNCGQTLTLACLGTLPACAKNREHNYRN